jgi:glycosyltransferase involved in cell wall biosynthesis
VDGLPQYLHHRRNGLFFPPNDVSRLADRLREVLSDETLTRTLSHHALDDARMRLSEASYAEAYKTMIERTLADGSALSRS